MPTSTDDTPFVREQLIRAGLELIDAEGTDSLSVRRLAQAAERTTMCVYTKFGGRSGLLMAMFERAAHELLAALDDGTAEEVVRWGTAHPARYAFLFEAPLPALGIDPLLRRAALTDVLARLGADGDARAQRHWADAHGRLALARILEHPAQDARAEVAG